MDRYGVMGRQCVIPKINVYAMEKIAYAMEKIVLEMDKIIALTGKINVVKMFAITRKPSVIVSTKLVPLYLTPKINIYIIS